jgi:uncharacterized membrane protein YphA (DoxX/SURF4 family)
MANPNESRIPHSLRLVIFFLRVALGLNFVYLGWTALFDHPLEIDLRDHAMNSLYGWLSAPNSIAWLPQAAAWAFLVIGICLVVGLFTRIASLIAIALVLASYLPTISFASFNVAQLVNDELIILFCLLVLIFGKAGHYLGVDKFLRWSRRHRE